MNDHTDATSIFAPLWRRKWLILAVGVLVGVASYFYYKQQRPTYVGSTKVYLGEESSSEKPTGKSQGVAAAEQVQIINSIVVGQVRERLREEHRGALGRGPRIKAKSPEKSPFITITVEGAHSAKATALLANLTAQTYIRRQHAKHLRSIEKALTIDRIQLRRIELASVPTVAPAGSKGKKSTSSTSDTASILRSTNLSTKIDELEASLAAPGAQQLDRAKPSGATLLSPQPRKDAIFGFVLGMVLAAIAAYVLSRFDRRLRSLAGIESVFGAQILAALPKVTRPIVRRDGVAVPSRLLLEPLRRLHAAVRLGDGLEQGRRIILFVSPDAGDGKSTLVADLALVQRDAGDRVAVVEANFRRPVQARLLGVEDANGLAEVLERRLPLEDALRRVAPAHPSAGLPDAVDEPREAVSTSVASRAGSLFLLSGSNAVANPPALLAYGAVSETLSSLAAEFDYVLIDVPSPLEFSDVMPLFGMASEIVIVARAGHTRESAAQRLVDLLARASTAPVLGVVANCVQTRDSERYGFSAPNGRAWPGKLIGR